METNTRFSRRISKNELLRVLKIDFVGKTCWQFNKYLGSMLLFDFGEKFLVFSRSGEGVKVGENMLSVRYCYWEAIEDDKVCFDSDTISDEKVADLRAFF